MKKNQNPFHDLWLTEILSPNEFVQMFSPELVKYTGELFSSGNVVVRGRQGSGKSMLLRLLDIGTRIAYHNAKIAPPIPNDTPFINASVNLIRINISAITSRWPEETSLSRERWTANVFADFLNYSLALSLFTNLIRAAKAQESDSSLRNVLGIDWNSRRQNELCKQLRGDVNWHGQFSNCVDIDDVVSRIRDRLIAYRSYFNFNSDRLEGEVEDSRTEIGAPLSALSESLKSVGVMEEKALILFTIDQHEELYELEKESGFGDTFRKVVNKALARRDRRCGYRLGTRHYAWSRQEKIWDTGSKVEELRDYSVIDIDELFRCKEDLRISDLAFRAFANDVFRRRLVVAGFQELSDDKQALQTVVGKTPPARKRAMEFAIPLDNQRFTYPNFWSEEWKALLHQLREDDPLNARLGEAWLLQRSQIKAEVYRHVPPEDTLPWLESRKKWWRKERNEVALMHLASESAQSLSWYGDNHIIGLSAWNILTFLGICRTIWTGWLRESGESTVSGKRIPNIRPFGQTVGIYEASKLWVDKLREGQYGEHRRRFIRMIGEWISKTLRDDHAMSNPGHNGFSLKYDNIDEDSEVMSIIRYCRDYGDLIESEHTSKSGGERRLKWYLNPILCPYFGIPYIRTKEPIYTTLNALERMWKEQKLDAIEVKGTEIGLFENW